MRYDRLMAKPRRAQKVRKKEDFTALLSELFRRRSTARPPVYAWSLDRIKKARDAQLRGDFAQPSKLADSSLTDDAIFVAFGNRLAPHRAISTEIVPADDSKKAATMAVEADALYGPYGIALTIQTMLNVGGALVNFGVAFLRLSRQVRDDGTRVDLYASYWPIEHVRWDEYKRCFVTSAEDERGSMMVDVEIHHGDGEWVIIADREHEPWKHGAILSTALLWARHAFANADWARNSKSHGNPKVVGELPSGMPLQNPDGSLTPEAAAFADMLRDLASEDSPVGVRPSGSKTEIVANNSTQWQVFKELSDNAAKGAARVYLGTDGVLGAAGGAPGVDITALFGVAATLVQGDLETIELCLSTGLLEPWAALNFGDSTLAPKRKYLIPRAEEQSKIMAIADREAKFYDAVKAAKGAGFAITQDWVNETAKRYQVKAPIVPAAAEKAPTVPLAPTDVIDFLTPNQVLATIGVPPDATDPEGNTKIRVLRAREEAAKAASDRAATSPPSA